MSLRLRLTLLYSFLLGLVLLTFAVLVYLVLAQSLISGVDATLRTRSAQIHGVVDASVTVGTELGFGQIHIALPSVSEMALPDVYIQVLDERGQVVASSPNLQGQNLPLTRQMLAQAIGGKAVLDSQSVSDFLRVRLLATPLYVKDRTLVMLAGHSLYHIDNLMRQALYVILAGFVISLILAFFTGWLMTQRALSPVQVINQTAERIASSADVAERIPIKGPMDELGRLAATFNRMLDRLEEAFHSQRNFVDDSSHELRTPLTVIKGNLELLKKDMSEEDRRESLRAIEKQTEQMGRIVSDLMLLARLDSGTPMETAPLDLKDLLEDVYEQCKLMAGKRKVVLHKNEALFLNGDAARLKQMLLNLVDNASKYTPEDSTIALSLKRENGWAKIQVSDNGDGIPLEHLPYLFDRFYRVDKGRSREKGGTGLGLSIVKGVAEAHGGRVSVSSQVGQGATFSIWLKL